MFSVQVEGWSSRYTKVENLERAVIQKDHDLVSAQHAGRC